MLYAVCRFRKDVDGENYLYDCLWAMATDMRFRKDDTPTLPRWREAMTDKRDEPARDLDEDDIITMFRNGGKLP